MNKITSLLLLSPLLLALNCQPLKTVKKQDQAKAETIGKVKIGFNQNFSMMPNESEEMYKNIQLLKPKVLRYPGGTITHSWDWRAGVITKRNSDKVHPISEIKTLVNYTKAEFVFVLDIANKTVDDQIEMLKAIQKIGVAINYIELGNELYAQEDNYRELFPSGKVYATKVNQWVPRLRKEFPNAKIAPLLLGRKVQTSNDRMYNWNRQVVDNTIALVDAYTYHIYINEKSTFVEEKADFIEIVRNANTNSKELWITEYGNKQDKSDASYFTELTALADFVESFPNVTLALNHQIVGGTKAKLTEDGKSFIEEGKMYLKRVN
jgi:hypothetical protein